MTLQPRPTTLGIVRGISYGLFGPADDWVDPARELGAGLVRLYLYWSQIEPQPGQWDWTVPDALLAQLTGSEQVWVTVCSSSPWGTRVPSDFQPPSPALDDAAFDRFVTALAQHLGGRVQFWQCNNEVSNSGMLWAGDCAEYAHQLRLFARAVRAAAPDGQVVLAGCGFDALSSPQGSDARRFYEELAAGSSEDFDVFSLNLYGDPYAIPENVAWARGLMRAHGYDRPIVVGEYNGPTILEFPEAGAALEATMVAAFAGDGNGTTAQMSTADLAEQVASETPDRRALRELYATADRQPQALRMFMQDAPQELRELRERIACRQLVQRTILILATGIDTLCCWNLAPEVGNYTDRLNIMDLLFGTLALMDYREGRIAQLRPQARTYRIIASVLGDATRVERVDLDDAAHVYTIDHSDGRKSIVGWIRESDPLREDDVTREIDLPWSPGPLEAIDAFGNEVAVVQDEHDGSVRFVAGITPVFVRSVSASGPERRSTAEA